MKFNHELSYDILAIIQTNPNIDSHKVTIPGYTEDEIGYHIHMMANDNPLPVEGIRAPQSKTQDFPTYFSLRLTKHGHDILEYHRE